MTMLDRVREIATGKPTRPEMPVEISEDQLTPADPPEIRGSHYFLHPRWGILRPRNDLVPETVDWPPLPFVEERDVDGIRWARLYEIVDPATWDRITKPQPVRPTDMPSVPVDALRGLPMYARDPEVFIPGPKREIDPLSAVSLEYAIGSREGDSRLIAGKPRASTAAEMIERYTRKGIALSVAPDGRLVARSADGRLRDYQREALRRSARFLAGHIRGKPLSCAWCPSVAATVLEPEFVPACTEHAA